MSLLFSYLRKYWPLISLALVLATINQVFSLLDPLIFRHVIDDYATRFAELTTREFFRGVTSRLAASAADRDWRLVGFGAATLLILQQFTVYAYNPLRHVPRQGDRAAGDQFISQLRAMPGNVLVWAHGQYGPMAGKGAHLHEMAFIDAAGQQSWPPRSEDHRRRRQQVTDTLEDAADWMADCCSCFWITL